MSLPTTFEATPNAISSPGSVGGLTHCDARVLPIISRFGLAAVLASLSARQANALGLLTIDISGRTGDTSSLSDALQSSLENRLRRHLIGSDLCEVTWKEWATPWGQSRSRPRARVRTTFGIDTGSSEPTHKSSTWVSPTARDGTRGSLPARPWDTGVPLSQQAAMWQTMVSDDALERERGKFNSRGEPKLSAQAIMASWPTPTSLSGGSETSNLPGNSRNNNNNNIRKHAMAAIQTWPTPTTRDHKDGEYCANVEVNGLLGRMVWPTPTSLSGGSETSNPPGNSHNNNNNKIREHAIAAQWPTPTSRDHFPAHTPEYIAEKKAQGHGMANLNDTASHSSGSSEPTERRGALNPEFVCWLMGFPAEWVYCGVSAMQSIPGRQRRSSARASKR